MHKINIEYFLEIQNLDHISNIQMTVTIHIKYLEITVINQNYINKIYK